MPAPVPLRVFLSYAHETPEHTAQVRALAARLQAEGMEVTIDLDWPAPVEGWWLWVEREVTAADLVLAVVTADYRTAFEGNPKHWPGPVVTAPLYEAQIGHQPFIPIGFSAADAAHRPGAMGWKTFYSVGTEQDLALLLRMLSGYSKPPEQEQTEPEEQPESSLPPLDRYVAGLQARLDFHRRAWRYFHNKLKELGIVLEEHLGDEGALKLTGPGITIDLILHGEHADARLDILAGTARIYANLLDSVAGARQPVECTELVFTLKPEWKLITPYSLLLECVAGTGIKPVGQKGLTLDGWIFLFPAIMSPESAGAPLKITARKTYPWPLNQLQLLLYLLENGRALY